MQVQDGTARSITEVLTIQFKAKGMVTSALVNILMCDGRASYYIGR
jgi:prepilin-type processing-associated H-X9-DG protein